jgi:molecular chaperone IbpA
MRTIDLSPLYRSVVGFDRLAALLDAAASNEAASGYPPYNIERTAENAYRIEIAVAGFKSEELGIEVKENLLTVTGRKPANDEAKRYLSDGLLSISLKRELPEALKPRTIEIKSAAPLIEGGKVEGDKIEGEKAA